MALFDSGAARTELFSRTGKIVKIMPQIASKIGATLKESLLPEGANSFL